MFSRLHRITTATLLLALACIPARAEQLPVFFGRNSFDSSGLDTGDRAIAQTPNEATEEIPTLDETETPNEATEETPTLDEIETPDEATEETPTLDEIETPDEATEETPTLDEIETPDEATEETPTLDEIETPNEATDTDSGNWEEFTSTRGGFAISLPGTPIEDIAPADPDLGTLEIGSYVWESEASQIAYGVFYKVLPSAPSPEQVAEFLDRFRDDFVAEGVLDGELLNERPLDLDRYTGREISVEGAEGYIKARVYLVDERLYLLVAIAPNPTDFPGDRFLNSFQLR
ncbi:MAG: hypothetical protein SVX43_14250 [Cyanobacteriota bacterium]|nr:hypothetical protein [Cyanobacteriota bacterium]